MQWLAWPAWLWPGVSGTVGETTLTETQLASHNHKMLVQTGAGATSSLSGGNGAPLWSTGYLQNSGGSQPHTHALSGTSGDASGLPPYYALTYIMRCA